MRVVSTAEAQTIENKFESAGSWNDPEITDSASLLDNIRRTGKNLALEAIVAAGWIPETVIVGGFESVSSVKKKLSPALKAAAWPLKFAAGASSQLVAHITE